MSILELTVIKCVRVFMMMIMMANKTRNAIDINAYLMIQYKIMCLK